MEHEYADTPVEELAVQNHFSPIDVSWIPHQLRPMAREMTRNGEHEWGLVTATQLLMRDYNSRQPFATYYAAERVAFNKNASITFRQF